MLRLFVKMAFLLAGFSLLSCRTLFAADPAASPTPRLLWGLDPQVIAALAGAIIAGLFALGVGFLAYRREARSQDALWIRDKLFTVYSDCIYYLIKLSLSSLTHSTKNKDVRQHFSESQRFLNLLRGYHHADRAAATELLGCTRNLAAASDKTKDLSTAADDALDTVKRLFADDPRIQVQASR